MNVILVALAAVVSFTVLISIVLYVSSEDKADEPMALPAIGECEIINDCPVRMSCYLDVPLSYLTKDSADDDTILDSACGCYHFYGEEGNAGTPGDSKEMYPDGGYCQDSSSYKPVLVTTTSLISLIVCFTTIQLYRTVYQLTTVGAFSANSSGIVLFLLTIAATSQFLLCIVYILEIGRAIEPAYKLNDSVRPFLFGIYAASQISALMNVCLMWADVWEKSKTLAKNKSASILRLRRLIAILSFLTLVALLIGAGFGLPIVPSLWTLFTTTLTTVFYYHFGNKLGRLLSPADITAPGAVSSKLAASQITKTSMWICIINVGVLIALIVFAYFISRPNSGALAFLFLSFTLIFANFHQIRMLDYIRFGSRKKLHKGGFGTFRSGLMVFSTSSAVGTLEYGKGSASSAVSKSSNRSSVEKAEEESAAATAGGGSGKFSAGNSAKIAPV